jgi:hypothetical protein
MPPRYAYWTIIAGGLPTAFRAAEREDLLPTFQRIKAKHSDAEMKWFAHGKLWESPDAARAAQHRGSGSRIADSRAGRERGRDWRPGGEHRDPRQKFIDAKKNRNSRIRKERWEHKNAAPAGSGFGRDRAERKPFARARDERGERKPPENKKPWESKKPSERKKTFEHRKPWARAQGTDEPQQPPRPRGPNREPKPSENPEPTPAPKPPETTTPPPGPPERGSAGDRRPFRPQRTLPRGPRRR